MLQQIDHIGIAVRNLDDTVAFYRDVMGLEVSATEIFSGMKIAFLRIGASELELLEDMTPDGAIARHVATHRLLREHGDLLEARREAVDRPLAGQVDRVDV